MVNGSDTLIEIGQIVATHGLRGDVKVRLNSGDPEVLMAVDQVTLRLPAGGLLDLDIVRKIKHKGQVLLRFKDHESINEAELFIRSQVLVTEDELPELKDGELYWRQLQGLKVVDQVHGDIGVLNNIYSTAAHDTYVVEGCFGEVLIPAVKQFILDINLDVGVVSVSLPEGLVPEDV
jgi:16S rRNA processing protein RimM